MNPAYIIFIISCAAWIFIELLVLVRDKGKVDGSKDKKTKLLVMMAGILAIIFGFLFSKLSAFQILENHSTLFIIGTILIWIGILFRFWAIRTLGKFFRTTVMIQENHKIIQAGPYRYLRHPAYTGTLLALTGAGIATGSWPGLIIMETLVFVSHHQRIIVEEKELERSLGQDYRDYKKETKRLIPFVY